MRNTALPDEITMSACRWLLDGGKPGRYSGPAPASGHDLAPLLSRETESRELSLYSAGAWFRLEQTVRPVLGRLAEKGMTLWAIKGFDLARSVYPFPGGRTMCDADLMLPIDKIHPVLNIFRSMGWSRKSPGDGIFNSGIVSEMKLYMHSAMVELHTHIFYFPATFPGKLPEDLFRDGRELEPGLRGLSWHNALLMVLLHAVTNINIRPVWWTDICLLCDNVTSANTWDRFCRGAWQSRLGEPIAELIVTAARELGAPVPDKVIAFLEEQCGEGRVAAKLRSGRRIPTLMNLLNLRGWKKVSWLYALLYLVLTGQSPLREKRQASPR